MKPWSKVNVKQFNELHCSQSDPRSWYYGRKIKVFMTLQIGQERVKVKTTGIVHNFIILSNYWNHDQRSKSNGSMSYGSITKWPAFMVQCAKKYKFLWPCKKIKKGSRSKQQVLCTTSSSYLLNCWNHDQRSKSNGSMSYGSITKWPAFMVQCAKKYKFLWPCKKVKKGSRSKQQVLCTTSSSYLLNCWNHDRRSMSNGWTSYGVHKKIVSDAQMVGITRSLLAYVRGQKVT